MARVSTVAAPHRVYDLFVPSPPSLSAPSLALAPDRMVRGCQPGCSREISRDQGTTRNTWVHPAETAGHAATAQAMLTGTGAATFETAPTCDVTSLDEIQRPLVAGPSPPTPSLSFESHPFLGTRILSGASKAPRIRPHTQHSPIPTTIVRGLARGFGGNSKRRRRFEASLPGPSQVTFIYP